MRTPFSACQRAGYSTAPHHLIHHRTSRPDAVPIRHQFSPAHRHTPTHSSIQKRHAHTKSVQRLPADHNGKKPTLPCLNRLSVESYLFIHVFAALMRSSISAMDTTLSTFVFFYFIKHLIFSGKAPCSVHVPHVRNFSPSLSEVELCNKLAMQPV